MQNSLSPQPPFAIVVCGPSGCGKTTVGKWIANHLHCDFLEGDDYHSAHNVAKMKKGIPLTDDDRLPWLFTLHGLIRTSVAQGKTVVLSCSALKRKYRDLLRGSDGDGKVYFVMLTTNAEVLRSRVGARKGHYMPASLVTSQLELLEPLSSDETGVQVCSEVSVEKTAKKVIHAMNLPFTSRL
ncbi:gluconokinase [Angomonas deanei]|uniref:Gluconokinase n=1 Tax=Angomonas deanei TaxID=59799 RepID=S9VSK9_9TRYP|nr:gluconokinase [Angomonas deanei]EPY43884.1 gluconokinase [Angomonas deanei]CAD2218937.1 Cytidylate kinase/AAA domain/Shikimate kinase, putative [Angomonas deanei]|eukprot:EPY40061.1 gluconokinase [Angomonas deanei]